MPPFTRIQSDDHVLDRVQTEIEEAFSRQDKDAKSLVDSVKKILTDNLNKVNADVQAKLLRLEKLIEENAISIGRSSKGTSVPAPAFWARADNAEPIPEEKLFNILGRILTQDQKDILAQGNVVRVAAIPRFEFQSSRFIGRVNGLTYHARSNSYFTRVRSFSNQIVRITNLSSSGYGFNYQNVNVRYPEGNGFIDASLSLALGIYGDELYFFSLDVFVNNRSVLSVFNLSPEGTITNPTNPRTIKNDYPDGSLNNIGGALFITENKIYVTDNHNRFLTVLDKATGEIINAENFSYPRGLGNIGPIGNSQIESELNTLWIYGCADSIRGAVQAFNLQGVRQKSLDENLPATKTYGCSGGGYTSSDQILLGVANNFLNNKFVQILYSENFSGTEFNYMRQSSPALGQLSIEKVILSDKINVANTKVDSSGFTGKLAPADDTIQEIVDKVDKFDFTDPKPTVPTNRDFNYIWDGPNNANETAKNSASPFTSNSGILAKIENVNVGTYLVAKADATEVKLGTWAMKGVFEETNNDFFIYGLTNNTFLLAGLGNDWDNFRDFRPDMKAVVAMVMRNADGDIRSFLLSEATRSSKGNYTWPADATKRFTGANIDVAIVDTSNTNIAALFSE